MSSGTLGWVQVVRRFFDRRLDSQLVLNGISPLLLLLGWEIGARTELIDTRFFPAPSSILSAGWRLLADGSLVHHTLVSLGRVLPAFIVASALAVVVGLLMGWSDRLYAIIDPIVSALYPLPKVVLLPVIFLVFGLNDFSRILALGSAIFLLVVINTVAGAREVDPVYIEAAHDNGATGYALIREVLLPASLPHIFSGLSLGMGVAFILIIVVEMAAADSGLGYVIWNSWELFTIDRMYVAIAAINLLGVVFTYGIEWTGRYLVRWQDF
ncbi:ABC transporter permease [Halobellus salinisoli]|uniref:ABC transporter permease n=1 Tax=Halobellus salinisoli TaxID=3108500 RepID=UPI00300829D6